MEWLNIADGERRLVGGRGNDEGENLDRIARTWIRDGVGIDACGCELATAKIVDVALADAGIDVLAQVEHCEMEIRDRVATTSRCAMVPNLVGVGLDARDVAPHVDVATTNGVVGVAIGYGVDSDSEMDGGVARRGCGKTAEFVDTNEQLVASEREAMTEIVLALTDRYGMRDLASIAREANIVDRDDIAIGRGFGIDRETELDGVGCISIERECDELPARVATLEDDIGKLTRSGATDFDLECGIVGEIAIAI
jgi:hypothetical protein